MHPDVDDCRGLMFHIRNQFKIIEISFFNTNYSLNGGELFSICIYALNLQGKCHSYVVLSTLALSFQSNLTIVGKDTLFHRLQLHTYTEITLTIIEKAYFSIEIAHMAKQHRNFIVLRQFSVSEHQHFPVSTEIISF